MENIRILIADDHAILRDGLKLIIKNDPSLKIIGEAKDGKEAVRMNAETKPDIIIMDIDMPIMNGIDAVKEIRKIDRDVKIIILTMYEDKDFIMNAISMGINGYLYKKINKDELLSAIHFVYKGKEIFSPTISKILEEIINSHSQAGTLSNQDVNLSEREKEIIRFISNGKSNKQIAAELFLSIFTIKNHRKNIMHKLGFNNVSQLIRYAIENKYVNPVS